jgi:hypothetical protein
MLLCQDLLISLAVSDVLKRLSSSSTVHHADVTTAVFRKRYRLVHKQLLYTQTLTTLHCTDVNSHCQVLRLRREKEQEAAAAQAARQQAAAAQDASSRDGELLRSTKELLQQARSAVAALQEQVLCCLHTHAVQTQHTQYGVVRIHLCTPVWGSLAQQLLAVQLCSVLLAVMCCATGAHSC